MQVRMQGLDSYEALEISYGMLKNLNSGNLQLNTKELSHDVTFATTVELVLLFV